MDENNFNQLENPNAQDMGETNTTVETNVTFDEKPMEPARPIDAPIPAPVMEPAPSSPIEKKPKGNKGLIAIIIVLVALLLGAVGYILYSEGIIFGEKKDTTKETDKKDSTKKDTTEEVKEQVINFDSSKYERTATTEEINLGTLKIKGIEYVFKYTREDCSNSNSVCKTLDIEDVENYSYISILNISRLDGKKISEYMSGYSLTTDKGIKTIAILDDRYVFIDTGDRPDLAPSFTNNLFLLDSENLFEDAEKYTSTFREYSKITNGDNDGNIVKRNVGYVDSNSYKIATCNRSTTTSYNSQKYTEYIITVKNGEITTKEDYSIDSVFCSAQY